MRPSKKLLQRNRLPMKDDELKRIRNIEELSQEELDKLTADQAKILKERFNIDPNNQNDIKNIQKKYDETRKRIKEIESKALNKLKGNNDDPGPDSA